MDNEFSIRPVYDYSDTRCDMKLFRKFFRFMNPAVSPDVFRDIDRRSLKSIFTISIVVLLIEMLTLLLFFFSHAGQLDRNAAISLSTVGYSIFLCAFAAMIASRLLKDNTLPHLPFLFFKIIFFAAFCACAVYVDFRHYTAGEQMLTFYGVCLVMICFVTFKPWVGTILIISAYTALYLVLYFHDHAAGVQPLNYMAFALASVACNAILFHSQIQVSVNALKLEDNNRQLENASRRDGLTGLLNRLALETDASKMTGRPLTAYMIDINYFKEINDRYGHIVGDSILKEISDVLKDLYPDANYYRYGGDEFLVLTHKPGEYNYGSYTYDYIQRKNNVKVSLSIGSAQSTPDSYQELFELISIADRALYEAKQRTHSS